MALTICFSACAISLKRTVCVPTGAGIITAKPGPTPPSSHPTSSKAPTHSRIDETLLRRSLRLRRVHISSTFLSWQLRYKWSLPSMTRMPESVRRDTKYSWKFLLLTPTQPGGPWNPSPWPVRTEKSTWYGVCGRLFRVSMGYSNREIRLVWCLWLSLSGSDGLFEQRNPLDMVFVAVPFGLRRAIRTEKSAWYDVCGCPFRQGAWITAPERAMWTGSMVHSFCHTFMLPDTAVSAKDIAE